MTHILTHLSSLKFFSKLIKNFQKSIDNLYYAQYNITIARR
nr:MAG TPA: hypothetical protein [Caudoviricetes sp.]